MKGLSYKHIGELVKKKRLEYPKELTQEKLSHALGYKNGQFVSNLERGKCCFPQGKAPLFCEFLKIERHELLFAIQQDSKDNFMRFFE